MNVIEYTAKHSVKNNRPTFHSRDGEKELFRGMAKTGLVPETLARNASVNYDENDKAELDGWYKFLSNEKESA